MSYTVQAAEPNASQTVRGVVTTGAQTFAGPKTFASKVTVAAQGGIALQLDVNDYINWGAYQLGAFGGQIYTPNADGYRTQGANGIWMGGINSAFTSAGLFAASQGYAVDVQQGQDKQVTLIAAKTGANVVFKIGQSTATPNVGAELVRMGYGMNPSDLGDGTAVFSFFMDGRLNIAGGSNKELRFAGNPVVSLASSGGVALLGAHADAGAGEAAVNFGNSVPLTEGSGRDLVRVRNGNPFTDALVFSISPAGNVVGAGTFAAAGVISSGSRINAASKYQVGGVDVLIAGVVTTNDTGIQGNVANGAASVATSFGNANALSTAGAKIAAFYSDAFVTQKLAIDKSGKLVAPTGTADAIAGVATLVGGTVTVNTTSVKAGSTVLYARKTTGGAVGHLSITIVDATSFTINSSSGTETSSVSWWIIN